MSELDLLADCPKDTTKERDELAAALGQATAENKRLKAQLDEFVYAENNQDYVPESQKRIEQLEAALNWIGDAHIDDMTEIMDYARESVQSAGDKSDV
ncbi:hypothetical protein LCGC14_3054700 [marine sediment metagenome]|uniref:Uncharacterized protein n=1 Tax=marine sediment metagenome TaxID=412755 RepID=A0A0F8YTL1_9ZZZZ